MRTQPSPSEFTLPLSRDGRSALVPAPPWYFGGRVLEVVYQVDMDVYRALLPAPLAVGELGTLAAVCFADMTSVSNEEMAFQQPERCQFHECLFKLYCSFEGSAGWYVPATWVDQDVSLMRGFLLGFGKKMGRIAITRLHKLNKMVGGVRAGARISASCVDPDGPVVRAEFRYVRPTTEDKFAGSKLYTMRHYPAADGSGPMIQQLSELMVEDAVKGDIWIGDSEVRVMPSEFNEVTRLQPKRVLSARIFDEGFTLLGAKVLMRYEST